MPTRSWNSAHFRSRNQMVVKNNKLIFLEWQAVAKEDWPQDFRDHQLIKARPPQWSLSLLGFPLSCEIRVLANEATTRARPALERRTNRATPHFELWQH